jgi:hypothetical protein
LMAGIYRENKMREVLKRDVQSPLSSLPALSTTADHGLRKDQRIALASVAALPGLRLSSMVGL